MRLTQRVIMPDEIKKEPGQSPSNPSEPVKPAPPAAPAASAPGQPSVSEKKLAAKAAATASMPWMSPLVDEVQKQLPGALLEAHTMVGQNVMVLETSRLLDVCKFMRQNSVLPCDYLVDVTAVDYPPREKRFDVLYVLHSFEKNERVRLKFFVGEEETIPSVAGIWPTANWLEREVFDMFGIKFSGHPNLIRILLPEGWKGHPLRKDCHIQQMDDDWVRENLNIESGQ
jgi:NADH-quinone oxidoreductase subunit C